MAQSDDPIEVIRRLAESHFQIRLGRGVVGKTGHATLGLFALWAVILLRLSENLWFDGVLLAGGLVVTGIYCWWTRKTHEFAERNPGLALLEGAELIEYQRFEAQTKSIQSAPGSPAIPDPTVVPRLGIDPTRPDQ